MIKDAFEWEEFRSSFVLNAGRTVRKAGDELNQRSKRNVLAEATRRNYEEGASELPKEWGLDIYCVVMNPHNEALVLRREGEEVWRVPMGTPTEKDLDICSTVARIVKEQTGLKLDGFFTIFSTPYYREKFYKENTVVLGYACTVELQDDGETVPSLVLPEGASEAIWVKREQFGEQIKLANDYPEHGPMSVMSWIIVRAFQRASEWPLY